MKNKTTTAILGLILGGIGIQKFYLKETKKGVLSVLFCWTCIPFIVGIYDFVRFLRMSKEYFEVKYNNNINLKCSTCKTKLSKANVSFLNFGAGNGACKKCLKKIKEHSRATGKRYFEEDEVQKILNGEIKNRPLPKTNEKKFHVPEKEVIEDFELPQDINSIKLNSLAQIIYIDSKGQKSERRIKIYTVSQTLNDDYIIKGYCHEKRAQNI